LTEQKWLTIYRETVHPLYRYMAGRSGGNRELTEDIVQETYLRALDSWSRKTVPDSPLAWLKRVARNILIDYLRKKRRDSQADAEIKRDAGEQVSVDPLKSLETFWAISSLGRKKAEILEAYYYDGMSTREIAGGMGISERAVEGHLRRARLSLRSLLPQSIPNGEKYE
jgi:RNA polymerase sigma factor (sigma-70 family)